MKGIMKKIIETLKENKLVHYIILILIGIALSLPLLSKIQIRETHDGALHLLRILGTLDTLKIGQIPPIINQNLCMGVGYSMNLFYPPLVTYFPLLIKLVVPSYSMALKIFGAICIILSGFALYTFTYQVTKKRSIALFAAVFYLIAPYKLANVYKRLAIGEFCAMVFMPLVFLGLYNLFEQDKKKHYYIAIGGIGLMLSHTVTTMYVAMFCIMYVLLNFKKLREKEIIKKCAINVFFILLISICFWFPLLEASLSADYSIMDNEIMKTNGYFAQANTISLYQLFRDKGEIDGTTFLLGLPTIIFIFVSPFVFRKIDEKYKSFYLLNIIFSIISIFMASRFFPWIIMPGVICKLQYPWRMLGYFNFFMSFTCGINLYIILKYVLKKDILRIVFVIIFVIISIISSLKIESQFFEKNKNADNEYETFVLENRKLSHKSINRDYMPVKAILLQDTYVAERKDITYVLEGMAQIEKETKKDLKDEILIKDALEGTKLEFPYFYYPGYKITLKLDDEQMDIKKQESENGYLSCVLPKDIESAEIKVEYVRNFYYIFFIYYIFNRFYFICYIYKKI